MTRSWLPYVAIGLVFAGIGGYLGAMRFQEQPVPQASARFFAESLQDEQGKMHKLGDWRGKMLVVNFWATWCAPCVQEMPELSALQAELANKKMQIIGIGIDSPTNIREFSAKHKIGYPLYVAGMSGTELARQFGNQAGGLPYTVLLGANGQIHKTYLGRLKMDQLRADLAKYGE